MKHARSLPSNLGLISLLLVLLVLCLVVFAALSLSGAVKEYRYAQQLAGHNTAYYSACSAAQRGLAQAAEAAAGGADAAEVAALLRDSDTLQDIAVEQKGEALLLSFGVREGEDRLLSVYLQLGAEGSTEILEWKIVSTKDWQSREQLTLISSFEDG